MKLVNKKFLAAASLAVLMAATAPSAMAEELKANTSAEVNVERTEGQSEVNTVTEQDIEKGWQDTKDAVSNTANSVADTTKKAYKDVKATLFQTNADYENNTNMKMEEVSIKSRMTAAGMIGEPVYNVDGNRVAKVSDIIIDSDGKAQMVVLADGDFTGLGKTVAFDYGLLAKKSADGDMMASITEDTITKAATFSYDKEDTNATTMPEGSYSLSKMLDAHLIGYDGEELADIDNISLMNGMADKIIVSYDKTLNMGGKKAALSFSDVKIKSDASGKANLQLTEGQTSQFKAHKRTAVN